MSTRRLFFALWPDHRQRDRMRDFISPLANLVEGRAIDRRNWHITLVYIGEFPEDRIDELHEAKQAVTVEPFRLRFDRLEFWPRPKIAALVPPTMPPELERLVEDLRGRVFAAGVNPEHQRIYRPHVTIVRNARPFETQRLAQSAVVEWSNFELVESVSETGGVTYRPLVKDF
ncbi:MAG: RNA 2',3'-cyclic phosphodiesterase [Gammaproteobacteria bacterium]|nr:RNA 2',3'-cyclic phosphodiesterase [Gammaproteobacteria bacterium]MDH3749367.1 RNA 2',3'-cyclic phosphodiesterase [Gammaproteobacteria bacterium]MDH3803959.1 RNA 2',3'-cyclic phosphodiesterase [Gammaproteobacteria bacterium]